MAYRVILTAFQPDKELAAELASKLAALCEQEGALVANVGTDGPVDDDDFARIADEMAE